MSPETIGRLYALLENNPPRVTLDAKTFRQLLDRAALRDSAEICNGDLVAQRDHAIEQMRVEQEWIIALRDLLSRKCEAMERGGVSAEDEAELLGFGGASA